MQAGSADGSSTGTQEQERPTSARSSAAEGGRVRRIVARACGESATTTMRSQYHAARVRGAELMTSTGRHSARLLRAHRASHAGERCFVIGNGPSLRETDLSLLRGEQTFGLNRIYLLFEKLGFATSYVVAVNDHVLRQSGHEIATVASQKFLTSRSRGSIGRRDDVAFVRSRSDGLGFSTDPVRFGLWEGATVTYVALQLAYYLGFEEVVLVGVDHSFSTEGPAHQLVVGNGADRDHFDPRYFGTGYQWQLPDLAASEQAYGLARKAFEADGRRVVDATVDGKLAVFPKVRYAEVAGA
jgi:hypothetical protein